MGLTSAFGISRSGLSTVEKWAETTSANIANADKPGYARKSVLRTADDVGIVSVNGIRRESDGAIDRMHRMELARMGRQDALASGTALYLGQLGSPDDPNSLSNRVADLQTAFVQLANAPEQISRQNAALTASEALARDLNAADAALDEATLTVQGRVEASVDAANLAITKIAELNQRIVGVEPGTQQHAMLTDELNIQLDALADIVDTRAVFDGAGRASVYTADGSPLVEDNSYELLSFEAATATLSLDGRDITPGRDGARGFSEARLAGEIELLREVFPQAQRQIDELARGLMVGFETADATVTAGVAGLFTDDGAAFDPANLDGLAGRIRVNDAVRPIVGGDVWRLRDGIAAGAEGPPADGTQLAAFVSMMEGQQTFDAAAGLGTSSTLAEFAAALGADQQRVRTDAEELRETFRTSAASLEATRSSLSGVNVDDELQQLILIEQSYAANSRVITVVSEMVDTLLAAV
ncbi:MAG: flagellar hook-associated protein FlgK [Pseudomonadota bacterium]